MMKFVRISAVAMLLAAMVRPMPAASPEETAGILARWRGGVLDSKTFSEIYDPRGRALDSGGEELRRAVLKAAVTEIYSSRALELGLDRDEDVIEAVDQWERSHLAALYRQFFEPDYHVTETEMRSYYREHTDDLFRRSPTFDFDMLFIRCGKENRSECRRTINGVIKETRKNAEAFENRITEFRSRYGKANGSFDEVSAPVLAPEIARVLAETPVGRIGRPVETPLGIFLARVRARKPGAIFPFEEVRERIEADLKNRARNRWIESLERRLSEAGFEIDGPVRALAESARLEGLDADETFLRERQRFIRRTLAHAALECESRLMPDDEELRVRLEKDPSIVESLRRRHLLVALIDASDNRYEAFHAVSLVKECLEAADDPRAAFQDLGKSIPGVRVDDAGFLSMREIERMYPKYPEVVRGMQVGRWKGPILLSPTLQRVSVETGRPARRDDLPSGFAFLFLDEERTPPFDALRQEVWSTEAYRILKDPEEVLKTLEETRDLELLVGLPTIPEESKPAVCEP